MISIPTCFLPYLGTVPRMIIVKMNTGCSRMVKPRDVKGIVFLDQGWPRFAIADQVKIAYFMNFKLLRAMYSRWPFLTTP
jgi:hypothetical protein